MIVDSSAILAILLNEPLGNECLTALVETPVKRMSTANLLEATIVVDLLPEKKYAAVFDNLIADLRIIIEPVTVEQALIGREARQRYGRGSKHRAHLNFGDCFAYALARVYEESLLFVGNDFIHTDLEPALS